MQAKQRYQTATFLSCLICSLMLLNGCTNKAPVNNAFSEPSIETDAGEDFDINANIDVENLVKIIQASDEHVIDLETVQTIMIQHGREINSTAHKYNEQYNECLNTLNYVVQDESDCASQERVILNILIEELSRIDWLKSHNQNDIQRSMWKALKASDYYSDSLEDSENDNDFGRNNALQTLIQSGADLNAPNWDGEVGAFFIEDEQLLIKLIKSGKIKYDITDKDGNCLLHKFASNEDMLNLLIQSGLNINTQNSDGQTPLFYARDPQIIEKYIKAGADINHADHHGNTPIFQASKNDTEHFPLTAQFVKHGADINHANHAGQTPVYEINIENGLQDFINLGAKLSVKDNEANTPLHTYDITKDDEDLNNLDIYLKNGIDIKSAGNLPLLKLCLNDKELNRLCIEKLTKAGADITAKNREGLGFLSYLLKNRIHMDSSAYDYTRNELKLKYDKIPNLINVIADMRDDHDAQEEIDEFSETMTDLSDTLEYAETALKDMLTDGVLDVNERMPTGETLLFYVTYHSTAEALIKAGTDIHAKNTSGQTALWRGNIYALLEAGADAKVVDNKGQSPLFARYIYYSGTDWGSIILFNSGDVQQLLASGANINAKDSKGRSLIFYVLENCENLSQEDCENNEYCAALAAISFLAAHGADVNIKDNDGITPLMLCDIEECVSELIKVGADINAKDNAGKSVDDHYRQNNNEDKQNTEQ
ncbi:MAG: ankyrin repeat domain-containing protein [Proteobacteria bacterium]|nr:ankyrin repeat domain-containing protein [Pseudomonadota bacterium]